MAQLIGQILGDRYEILRELASNTSQQTYLALDRRRYEQVVLNLFLFGKGMLQEEINLLQRTATALKKLNHAALPAYLDSFEVDIETGKGFALRVVKASPLRRQIRQSGKTLAPMRS